MTNKKGKIERVQRKTGSNVTSTTLRSQQQAPTKTELEAVFGTELYHFPTILLLGPACA